MFHCLCHPIVSVKQTGQVATIENKEQGESTEEVFCETQGNILQCRAETQNGAAHSGYYLGEG